MSDMHTLDTVNGVTRVAMHFPVPTGGNAVGTPWVTALLGSTVPTTILPDGDGNDGTIETAEKDEIEAGTVAEFITNVAGLTEGSPTSRQALLRTVYTAFKDAKTTDFQNRFNLYGHTESEA